MILWLLVALLQPPPDPHNGQFTTSIARRCASCHDKTNLDAEDNYKAAATMEKMVADLNQGPLKPYSAVSCFSCHRGGGPNRNSRSPQPLDRSAVRTMIAQWPGDARDPDSVKRTMSEYAVSLGVKCDYCHVPGNWKAETKPAMKATRAMDAVMNEFPKYFNLARASAFTCYTCHQGGVKVQRN